MKQLVFILFLMPIFLFGQNKGDIFYFDWAINEFEKKDSSYRNYLLIIDASNNWVKYKEFTSYKCKKLFKHEIVLSKELLKENYNFDKLKTKQYNKGVNYYR